MCQQSLHQWCFLNTGVQTVYCNSEFYICVFSDYQDLLDDEICCPIPKVKVLAEGIAPSAYKNTCREGLIWVEWRKVCITG